MGRKISGGNMKQSSLKAILATSAFAVVLSIGFNAGAITQNEVMTLVKLGIPEKDIISSIEKDRTVFDLKIQDILELKKAGVPDGVIKFMLSTAERFGSSIAAQPGTTGGQADVQVQPKTPEEILIEKQRHEEQERRRIEDAKKAEDARKTAYARGVLRRGLALADAGEWVEAVGVFQSFVEDGKYAPGTEEDYNAKYGMAAALANAKLYQSAAKLLVDVLLAGTERPFFQEAFGKLRALRREIIYNPPDLGQLTQFSTVGFSQAFQDEFNYVMGEFFYDYGNFQRALTHLDQVSPDSADGVRALYLKGLVQVRYKMFKSAVESLQTCIDKSEAIESTTQIRDLAYMALARIAYEAENHDAAILYYKKVGADSSRAGRVFYELAWTYLMKGDYSRALGAFHALHSPIYSGTFYPELWILEARVYGDLCYYDRAEKALGMFDTQVAKYIEPLQRFINAQTTPDDFYTNFLASINDGTGQNVLPKEISYPVVSDVEFYNLYRTIRQIEQEADKVQRNSAQLGMFANEMAVKLGVLRKDSVVRCGVKIQQALKNLDNSISEAQIHQTEIEVDINAAAIDTMTLETKMLSGETEDFSAGESRSTSAIAVIGTDTEVWPFEGEYWSDEVPYFRSLLESKCVD